MSMRSHALASMPVSIRRAIQKLGQDIKLARRKRSLTTSMMAERAGVAKTTYLRVERGDPAVSFGVYAMCLFVLGAGARIGSLLDMASDDVGLLLEHERLPKRVRPRKVQGGAT